LGALGVFFVIVGFILGVVVVVFLVIGVVFIDFFLLVRCVFFVGV